MYKMQVLVLLVLYTKRTIALSVMVVILHAFKQYVNGSAGAPMGTKGLTGLSVQNIIGLPRYVIVRHSSMRPSLLSVPQ